MDNLTEIKFYTPSEAAKMIRCTPQTLRKRIREGKIEAIREGGRWLISDKNLQKYLDNSTNQE